MYKENPTAVSPVSIADGSGQFEEASLENVANYPMARPLHIYTDGVTESDSIINDYLEYILGEDGQAIVPEVGYVKLELVDSTLTALHSSKL